jgi:hypothetical protein
MSGFTFADGFTNDLEGWTKAMEKTIAVPSYKRFLEVTSNYSLVVVANNPNLTKVNDRNQCHENCRLAELEGVGKRVSGWYLMNEFIYKEYSSGMMRLVHHSNLLLPDGNLMNPTNDENRTYHIFLRDDKRHFDFEKLIGYNDRMVFGDSFMVGREHIKAVPRNKVLFASEGEYDRDLYYERSTVHTSPEAVIADIPKGLTSEQRQRWMILKSSARFKT